MEEIVLRLVDQRFVWPASAAVEASWSLGEAAR
jgi:hypothetical protein